MDQNHSLAEPEWFEAGNAEESDDPPENNAGTEAIAPSPAWLPSGSPSWWPC